MSKNEPKTYNSLMKYLRDEKCISISGSSQKRKLMNIGYYHGYKGYRYAKSPRNRFSFSSFSELEAVYTFDIKMKALLYPCVMRVETALKNYVIEAIIEEAHTDNFISVYSLLLDDYKRFPSGSSQYKTALKKRLGLRDYVYRLQTNAYANDNPIAVHFIDKDRNLPIWAIFELFSLGEFGSFISCLNYSCRRRISSIVGFRQSDDTSANLLQNIVYVVKDIRNAIAHNVVVFDTRFQRSSIGTNLIHAIENETHVFGITFATLTDYLVLFVYLLHLLGISKTELRRLISDFSNIVEELRGSIPISEYNKIIYTDFLPKIRSLRNFV